MSGYDFHAHRVDARTIEYHLHRDGAPVSWQETATALQRGADAADPRPDAATSDLSMALARLVAGAGWPACFWECAAVDAARADQPLRMALVDAGRLDQAPVEPAAFAGHFGTGTPVVTFPNLGGDARLVVPTPQPGTPARTYAHLARFCREAPATQVAAVWRAVGTELLAWWAGTTAPLWLSTSGLGVGWLHVRLDSRPKYYSYQPFRALP